MVSPGSTGCCLRRLRLTSRPRSRTLRPGRRGRLRACRRRCPRRGRSRRRAISRRRWWRSSNRPAWGARRRTRTRSRRWSPAGYVLLDGRVFVVTPLGRVVCGRLRRHFPKVTDMGFTAQLEKQLDEVASGGRGCARCSTALPLSFAPPGRRWSSGRARVAGGRRRCCSSGGGPRDSSAGSGHVRHASSAGRRLRAATCTCVPRARLPRRHRRGRPGAGRGPGAGVVRLAAGGEGLCPAPTLLSFHARRRADVSAAVGCADVDQQVEGVEQRGAVFGPDLFPAVGGLGRCS